MGSRTSYPKDQSPSSVCIIRHRTSLISYLHPLSKRAKTVDEKEQRRIERVIRNRQAAQSSRERKRQEVEKLEGEKMSIEEQNQALKERLMTVEHEKLLLTRQIANLRGQLTKFQHKPPAGTPTCLDSSWIAPDGFDQQEIKQELDDLPYSIATPQLSFGQSSSSFGSPSTMTYSPSQSPPNVGLGIGSMTASPDLMQLPAALLCDLQCQSAIQACPSWTLPTIPHKAAIQLYTTTLTSAMLISAIYLQLMVPMAMIFNSLKKASPLPARMMTSTTSTLLPLIQWLISTPANLIPTTKTTSTTKMRTSTTKANTSSRNTPSRVRILRPRLLRRLLLSSPSLARPLKGATGWAQLKTSSTTGRNETQNVSFRPVACAGVKAGFGDCARSCCPNQGLGSDRKRLLYGDKARKR